MRKLWGGAFQESSDELVVRFTQSVEQDLRFWQEDLLGAVAHARMLGSCGIISPKESEQLVAGLEQIHEEGPEKLPSDAEDIHTAIELRLHDLIGDVADKLALARSRNDQVATSARLYLHNELLIVLDSVKKVQLAIVESANSHRKSLMPGFTHFQPAQPVTLGFHLLAHFWALQRDGWRAERLFEAANYSPLGAGAFAGTSFSIDRVATSEELGFNDPIPNALDAVSDRSFILDAVHACASIMISLSRLAHELATFSNPMIGFVRLSDKVTTGSIMLPQKRNPDVAELIRGRSAQLIGNYTTLASLLKGQMLGYNRDYQDDKPLLYNSIDITRDSLKLMALVLEGAEWDIRRMALAANSHGMTAVDLAESLTQSGSAFRDAHKKVGMIMGAGAGEKMPSARESVSKRISEGGPGPKSMANQLRRAKRLVSKPDFDLPH